MRLSHLSGLIVLLLLIPWAQNGFSLNGNHLIFLLTNYIIWVPFLPFIQGLIDRFNSPDLRDWIRLILQIALIIIIHLLVSNFFYYILKYLILQDPIMPSYKEIQSFLIPSIVRRCIDLALFIGVMVWYKQNQLLARQRYEMKSKEADLQRNKLNALKNQLNPHFLFNALHTISSQIGHDDDKAQDITVKMSHLLRKTLAINEREEHTLRQELEFVNDYLAIETERFHDRLSVAMEIDQDVGNTLVPTMTIQPLVENALKHGIAGRTQKSILEINVLRREQDILIKVINSLPESSNASANNTGIGLKNLQDRLAVYFNGMAHLTTTQKKNTFEATITIKNSE